MPDLNKLRPTKLCRVMDVVSAAGIDVAHWAIWSGGAAKAAANPKYCYEWSFVEPNKVVVLNVWFDDLREQGGTITLQDNLRESAALHRENRKGGGPIWHKRALKFDEAVRTASTDQLPIRTVICDGVMRKREELSARASKVSARQLDTVPWAVATYEAGTGRFTLTRGALPNLLVDQFSAGVQESPTETRSETGTVFVRNPAVRKSALARANGECEWCGQPGFTMDDGSVFLETHHVVPLSVGGPDAMTNVVGLCANHHREAHLGSARTVMRERLQASLRKSKT